MARWLGIDVGGANLKLADGQRFACSVPYELWRRREELPAALRKLLADAPAFDALAATMTGELADCYETKAEGVRHITGSLQQAVGGKKLAIYGVDGSFHPADAVLDDPLPAAASNWHALARFAAQHLPERTGVVVDIGSTTTDVIPVVDGRVATGSQTDTDRLLAGELVYTGVRRTPVCALAAELPYRGKQCPVAAELFATTVDVYRLLGAVSDPSNDTADGRSLAQQHCIDRLARQVGADRDSFTLDDAIVASRHIKQRQLDLICAAIAKVHATMQGQGGTSKSHLCAIASGSGEWLACEALLDCEGFELLSLSEAIGPAQSDAAAAAATAWLAGQGGT